MQSHTDGCGKRSARVTLAKVKALGHTSTSTIGNREVHDLVDVFEKCFSWWVETLLEGLGRSCRTREEALPVIHTRVGRRGHILDL